MLASDFSSIKKESHARKQGLVAFSKARNPEQFKYRRWRRKSSKVKQKGQPEAAAMGKEWGLYTR